MQKRHKYLRGWVGAHHNSIREGLKRARSYEAGKVIGIRLGDDIRARLRFVQQKYGLKSYRRAIITAVVVGLHVLEAHEPPPAA